MSVDSIIQKFSNTTILVIGDFMLDEYIFGSVDRISPEAPVPVVNEKSRKSIPGGAGNVVRNIVSLGADVILTGVIGRDIQGIALKASLEDLKINKENFGLIELSDRPTTCKTRIIGGNQQICRLDKENTVLLNNEVQDNMFEFINDNIGRVQGIIFSDYDKGVVTPGIIERTITAAAKKDIFISVDPQVSHFTYYKNVDVLTPNHHEAGRFLGKNLVSDDEIKKGGFEIIERLNSKMLIITRGEKGMTLFDKNRNCKHFSTNASEVFDVTGAGDTVISIFTLAMAAGYGAEEATLLSNKGAGIVVGKLGAATVTPSELLN